MQKVINYRVSNFLAEVKGIDKYANYDADLVVIMQISVCLIKNLKNKIKAKKSIFYTKKKC